jgi:hypothetical protein
MVPSLNVILLSFNNWNAFVSVHVDHTVSPSTVYVFPLKFTVNPAVLNFHSGTTIPSHAQSLNNVIVAPSLAAANASANVAYLTSHIFATASTNL